MSDPYNNDPFATDDNRIANERDANRALAASVNRRIAFDEGADIDDGMTDDEK